MREDIASFDDIKKALEILHLPNLITKDEIKKQYRYLSKKNHPDLGGDAHIQDEINRAYEVLMEYIEHFRYSFSDDELKHQFPGVDYATQFRQ